MEGDACYYHCVLCSYSTKAKLNLIQHVRSMKHQRSESLRKLQRLQKGLPEEEEDLSSIFTIRKCPSSDTGQNPTPPAPRTLFTTCGSFVPSFFSPPEAFLAVVCVYVCVRACVHTSRLAYKPSARRDAFHVIKHVGFKISHSCV